MAADLLRKRVSPQEVVLSLVERCEVSTRQAYRYVQQAQSISKPLPIPETKAVFTVKLPVSLIERVRQDARRESRPISDVVGEALESFLSKRRSHG
ncbi:MAG: hypothetical protein O2960_01190 [Verrucomicrobia bacterium]|nr:hypothetical protein [Verrucomicrobiota bacterium]